MASRGRTNQTKPSSGKAKSAPSQIVSTSTLLAPLLSAIDVAADAATLDAALLALEEFVFEHRSALLAVAPSVVLALAKACTGSWKSETCVWRCARLACAALGSHFAADLISTIVVECPCGPRSAPYGEPDTLSLWNDILAMGLPVVPPATRRGLLLAVARVAHGVVAAANSAGPTSAVGLSMWLRLLTTVWLNCPVIEPQAVTAVSAILLSPIAQDPRPLIAVSLATLRSAASLSVHPRLMPVHVPSLHSEVTELPNDAQSSARSTKPFVGDKRKREEEDGPSLHDGSRRVPPPSYTPVHLPPAGTAPLSPSQRKEATPAAAASHAPAALSGASPLHKQPPQQQPIASAVLDDEDGPLPELDLS